MRRVPLIAILAAGIAGAVSAAAGCSGDGSCPDPGDAQTDAPDVNSVDADSGADTGVPGRDAQPPRFSLDATAPVTSVRVANWSADAPAVDFCLGPHGANHFLGPLLGAAAASREEAGVSDAGATQLTFPLVSAYLPIAPGNYDARVVAAGSLDCSVGIIPDDTMLPRLTAGGATTLALVGATQPQGSQPSLRMVTFFDDRGIPDAVAMRVINASVDFPVIDFGVGKAFAPPFLGIAFAGASEGPDAAPDANVAFGPEASAPEASTVGDASADGAPSDAASPPVVDLNGYFPETLSDTTLSARATGFAAPVAVATHVSAAPGTVLTIVVLGLPIPAADGGVSTELLECVDNAGTVGLLSNCSVLPP